MRLNKPDASTRELVAAAARTLADAAVPTPEVDARLIAAHLMGVGPLEVFFADPPAGFADAFSAAIARRSAREPLQHILGEAPFGPLTLTVGPGVFIPRPETEVLADWAVRTLADAQLAAPTVVDLGTGSGALAIYIAHAYPNAEVIAVERSETARRAAAENAARNRTSVRVVEGDMTDLALLAELSGRVDLVVANPPYVPETPDLEPEVYRDPHEAVFSGADGMDAIRGLIPVAARLLKPSGALGIEHDDTTSRAVQELVLADGSFAGVQPMADLTGRARFVTASKVSP
ncbi:peptide chain release factor N(5)-glutamine methyltransferase [Corynebacterium sp. TA-R-1]|uniref:Release factor glutamine methyltransferase n=1 Tax=Corynebacterium stercoris TaxID=2943490 RepID=A0ABT1G2U4_9CORY|nr:peptide chain release factor N(5)-glutamine methyltransferase [Corynebacterium stercoris]MCP1387318.1 peptide chain release factor N(5)-glutamine methyltransferase [Corynebacterium stercoris]